ncbi:monocarboxylate transporter 13-like [Branchiostoma floridae x Branchiostoma japonicum]
MRARRVHERPPDGGWGWMILLSNFVMCACVFGVQKSFGVFFVEFREYFGESSGGTAWINSIMSAVAHGGGALAVPLSVRFGTRPVVMVGGVLSCLGLVLSTFANSILYLYFSLGVITGLSYAMVFAPSVAMLGRYFDKRRALVNGIALSGSGATFALAPVCQLLEQTYGWRGALLLLGGLTLNLCVSGALLRPIVLAADVVSRDPSPRTPIEPGEQLSIGTSSKRTHHHENDVERSNINHESKRENFSRLAHRKHFDITLLKKRRFLLFASADLLSSFSYLIPYVHVVPCARYRGIDETKAPFLLSVAGITEVLARVFSGWFSDLKIISKLHVYMMFIALNALACFLFPLATSYPALLAYSVAMGTCTGGFRALIMPLVADTVGVVRMPNAFGLTLVCEGVGILLGPPVAGWLYDATENYNSSFFVAGGCFVASLVPLCGLSYLNRTLQRDSVIATPIEQENEPSDVLCGSTPLVERETSF